MNGVEALARVLDPAESFTDTDGEMSLRIFSGERTAERILADPGPLLDALAEAGVLFLEMAPRIMGRNGRSVVVPARRRYVTEWRPTDARP